MVDGPLVRLCWRVGDAVDYWLTRAQLRIVELCTAPSRRRRLMSSERGTGSIERASSEIYRWEPKGRETRSPLKPASAPRTFRENRPGCIHFTWHRSRISGMAIR
jgi:hypothetical protein